MQILNPSYDRFAGAGNNPHSERILAQELQSTKKEDFSDEVADEVHYFGETQSFPKLLRMLGWYQPA